jgi:hypothetical protein
MKKDTLRMQFLSGVITEGEYKIKLLNELQYFHNGAEMNQIINYDDSDITDDLESLGQGSMDGQDFTPGSTYDIGGQEYKIESQGDEFKLVLAEALNKSLNESMIGGIVGIGAINQIPPRSKADYETAFEHFLGGKYGLNEVEEVNEGEQTIRSKSIKDYILSQIKLYPMYSAQLKSFESNIKNNENLTKEKAKEIIEKFIKITRRTEDVFDDEMKQIKNIDYQTDRDQMAAIQGGYY